MNDTIVAIATPPGAGGIGVIRLSGLKARAIVEKLWKGKVELADFISHHLYFGPIVDPGDKRASLAGSRRVLDEGLVVWMEAPHSYTGEEVVELQLHGSPILLQEVLGLLIRSGARLARPGEFTERAFLNGRLDLSQAEGVADLISAQSELSLGLANDQLSGRLSEAMDHLRNELVVLRAQCEAMLDFPEDEDVQVLRHDEIAGRTKRLSQEISTWLKTYDEGRHRREGFKVVLAGRPNVGKSSLLNALLSEDRAIVHPQAGTTRDSIEAILNLNGLMVRLTDTAGLREGRGEIESEGIRRSWGHVKAADLILFIIDASEPWTPGDRVHYDTLRTRPHLIVVNKIDLANVNSAGPAPSDARVLSRGAVGQGSAPQGGDPPKQLLGPPAPGEDSNGNGWREQTFGHGRAKARLTKGLLSDRTRCHEFAGPAQLLVSAKTSEGLEALKAALFEQALPHGRSSAELLIANQRHKLCLEKTLAVLLAIQTSAEQGAGLELIAADLLIAANHLGEITGVITSEEILGEIFSRFCLGK